MLKSSLPSTACILYGILYLWMQIKAIWWGRNCLSFLSTYVVFYRSLFLILSFFCFAVTDYLFGIFHLSWYNPRQDLINLLLYHPLPQKTSNKQLILIKLRRQHKLLWMFNGMCLVLMLWISCLWSAIYVLHSVTSCLSSINSLRISFRSFRINSSISFSVHLSNLFILIDSTSVDKLPLLNLSMAW